MLDNRIRHGSHAVVDWYGQSGYISSLESDIVAQLLAKHLAVFASVDDEVLAHSAAGCGSPGFLG